MSDETTVADSKPVTKLCHIVKRPDFEGYGFNLHSEKIKPGQYIGKVDRDSPAEIAGLKEGDRIIEVNGAPINGETHKQVVQRIKAIACEVRLLLIDVDGNEKSNNENKEKTLNMRNILNMPKYTSQDGIQETPGFSENISSISVVSIKRKSNTNNENENDHGAIDQPDSTVLFHVNGGGANTDKPTVVQAHPLLTNSVLNQTNNDIKNRAGSLQLPLTAAEMRAQILARKKYDPKNECVDLKKKFEIIQKL